VEIWLATPKHLLTHEISVFSAVWTLSRLQLPVAEAHPDWLYISPNSTGQNHTNDLVFACPSGLWYEDKVFEIFDEVLSRDELPSLSW
jgi:hypothetical protein